MAEDASSGRGGPDPVIVRPTVAHLVDKALNRIYTRPRSKIHMTRYPAHNTAFVPDQQRSRLHSFEVSVPAIMPPLQGRGFAYSAKGLRARTAMPNGNSLEWSNRPSSRASKLLSPWNTRSKGRAT